MFKHKTLDLDDGEVSFIRHVCFTEVGTFNKKNSKLVIVSLYILELLKKNYYWSEQILCVLMVDYFHGSNYCILCWYFSLILRSWQHGKVY